MRNKRVKESLFWVYELYFSGFEQESWDAVLSIYTDFYQSLNPRYERHLRTLYAEWHETWNPICIGSVVATLCIRESVDKDDFVLNRGLEKYVVTLSDSYLESYKTKETATPRQLLREVSTYSMTTRNEMELKDVYLGPNWLYYCRETPVWSNRIAEHGGKIDMQKKCVEFPCDDSLEEFYDRYGLEPDEQSNQTHEKHGIQL
jgi:hypothetical protein